MAKRGGQRAVHAVAYSFNKSGAYGWFAFVKSTSADKAANIAVTRLPKIAVASVKKCSFEKSDLPYYQAFSGVPPEKSSFLSKYF